LLGDLRNGVQRHRFCGGNGERNWSSNKSRRWSKAWNIWGLINQRGGSNKDERDGEKEIEASFRFFFWSFRFFRTMGKVMAWMGVKAGLVKACSAGLFFFFFFLKTPVSLFSFPRLSIRTNGTVATVSLQCRSSYSAVPVSPANRAIVPQIYHVSF
jgi:hypothetical protein